ncbi:AraC family transcriptional regulator [Vibrio caribbeanicus]|uniref:AraC family transcriptional regulator n=1 Tax=Vibrio caribbeanicus TaxID=701175 RepID=UPI0030D9A46A
MQHKENAQYKTSKAFKGIDIVEADFKKQSFSRHVHEGYTIGVIEEGVQRFYRSGENHLAGKNNIILVNADDVHTGEAATPEGWKYNAIYPTPEHFEFISEDIFEKNSLTPYFRDSVIDDRRIADQLRLVFDHIAIGSSTLLIETLLYSTFLSLAVRHGRRASIPQDMSINGKKLLLVKDFIDEYPEQDVSLEKLALLAGCSKYHFVRQFGKAFGLSPHAYQIQSRLKKAKQLLKLGVSISQIATDCGFHDQSHLARHFKKALGTTPKKFQKTSNPVQY